MGTARPLATSRLRSPPTLGGTLRISAVRLPPISSASLPYLTLPLTLPELRMSMRFLTTTSPCTVPWISAVSVFTVPNKRPVLCTSTLRGRDIAFNVSVYLELAAIAHFTHATDDGVFRDDEYALIFGH